MSVKDSQIPIKHGTTAGAALHKKRKIPLCDPCRLARNEYELQRNREAQEREDREREEALIKGRVLTRMALAYPQVFERIKREELNKRSLERARLASRD